MERGEIISLVKKSENKYSMHDFKYENSMTNINIYHPRALFINIQSSSFVFTFWK